MGIDDWRYICFIALEYEKVIKKLEANVRLTDLYNANIDLDEHLGYLKKLEEILHRE